MPKAAKSMKRFTVSLDKEQYEQLRRLAAEHKPPLSLQYLTRYALTHFLAELKSKKKPIDFIGDR